MEITAKTNVNNTIGFALIESLTLRLKISPIMGRVVTKSVAEHTPTMLKIAMYLLLYSQKYNQKYCKATKRQRKTMNCQLKRNSPIWKFATKNAVTGIRAVKNANNKIDEFLVM